MNAFRLAMGVTTLVTVLATGCGVPREGDGCGTSTGLLCATQNFALECRGGKFVSLPCRGPGGCQRSGDTITCDMNGNVEGDACASSLENKGLCTSDGTAVLECRDFVLAKTRTCRTCTVADGKLTCTPP